MHLAQITLILGRNKGSLRKRLSRLILSASFTASSVQFQDKKVHWRESAALIIARPTPTRNTIEFLFTKRTDHAKNLAGFWCYPGGASSSADSSSEWLDLFRRFDQLDRIARFKCLGERASKPVMYSSSLPSSASGTLLKEIALRLTAIRETFEECGILLCSPVTKVNDSDGGCGLFAVPDEVLLQWQARVKANPSDFLKLCKELAVLPCFEDLYEWSNWLTSTAFPPGRDGSTRRFDAISYMTILPAAAGHPKVVIDPDEVTDYKWASAQTLIRQNTEDLPILVLVPNYLYEMVGLRSVTSADELKALITIRQELGIQRLCPFNIKASDGIVSCMPGDDLFPQSYDVHEMTELEIVDKTLEDLEKSSRNLHRWQIAHDGTYKLLANTSEFREMYPTDVSSITVAHAKTYKAADILHVFKRLA